MLCQRVVWTPDQSEPVVGGGMPPLQLQLAHPLLLLLLSCFQGANADSALAGWTDFEFL